MAEVGDAYTELQKMGYFSPAPPLLRICPESGPRLWVPRFQRDKSSSHVSGLAIMHALLQNFDRWVAVCVFHPIGPVGCHSFLYSFFCLRSPGNYIRARSINARAGSVWINLTRTTSPTSSPYSPSTTRPSNGGSITRA
jgi:hypothetical protein